MSICPARRAGLREQAIGDELYIFGPDDESLIVLNSTSALIWNRCDGRHGVEDLLAELRALHPDVESECLRADVLDALAQLKEAGLLLASD